MSSSSGSQGNSETNEQEVDKVRDEEICNYLESLERLVSVTLPERLESLIHLKDAMSNAEGSQCFDSQDIRLVDEQIAKLTLRLERSLQEWKHKSQLYHETLVQMDGTLKARERILNDVNAQTDLFHLHPTLVQALAHKQAELVKSKEQVRAQLHQNWNSSVDS